MIERDGAFIRGTGWYMYEFDFTLSPSYYCACGTPGSWYSIHTGEPFRDMAVCLGCLDDFLLTKALEE